MRSLPALAVPAPTIAWPLRRRPLQAAALLAVVLLLHGLVLLALTPDRPAATRMASAQRPVAIRLLPPTPLAQLQAPAEAIAERVADSLAGEAPAQPAANRTDKRAQSLPSDSARTPPRAVAEIAAPAAPAAADGLADTPAPQNAAAEPRVGSASPAAESSADRAVPVYATRLPASTHLHYHLQRGAVVGHGQLLWQRQGDAYEISLEGELQGMPVLGSVSRGAIDADGVAPLRLAERRRSRELRAANFQRDVQRITFSGPQVEYPLLAGAQDRLSWMIQLPGIVEADPSLTLAGARVTLFVVGTRGDAEAWHFDVQGREALDLPAGAVPDALHLLREPNRPYDTRVEVWLDPARQHLPVRAVVTIVPGGQPLEFKLARAAQPAL